MKYIINDAAITQWVKDDPQYIQVLINLMVEAADAALKLGAFDHAHESIHLAAHLLKALQPLNDD